MLHENIEDRLDARQVLCFHPPRMLTGGGGLERRPAVPGSQQQTFFLLDFGIKLKERYSSFQNNINIAILSINFPRTFNNVVVMYVTQNGHGFLALTRKSLHLLKKVRYRNKNLLNLLSDDLVFL